MIACVYADTTSWMVPGRALHPTIPSAAGPDVCAYDCRATISDHHFPAKSHADAEKGAALEDAPPVAARHGLRHLVRLGRPGRALAPVGHADR